MKRLMLIVILVLVASAARAVADEPSDLYNQGAELLGKGQFAEAAAALRKEVDARPNNTKAWMYLATAYEKLTKWAEAASAWDKFVRLTESVDEKAFGEKCAKSCRDRASGKGSEDTSKPGPGPGPAKTPDAADCSQYETMQPVFFAPMKTQHFIVMAKNRALLEAAAAEAERHHKRIMDVFLFGREASHVITIRIFKDHQEYVKEMGMPEWSGGGYSARPDGAGGEMLAIDLYALGPDGHYTADLLTKTLPHEMTHAVIHESFGERAFGTLPRAINEGLAMYSEENTETIYERQLCEAAKKGGANLYKLGDLYRMNNYPPNVALFYAEAASATRFVVEHMKGGEFETFLNELKKGNSVNSALQTAKGATGDLLAAVEVNWLQMLREKADYYAKHPDKTETKVAKGPSKDPAKDPKKTTTDSSKPEPYDPNKNEKKQPGDEDDEKDTVIEVK